jgi:hypothetical protein
MCSYLLPAGRQALAWQRALFGPLAVGDREYFTCPTLSQANPQSKSPNPQKRGMRRRPALTPENLPALEDGIP